MEKIIYTHRSLSAKERIESFILDIGEHAYLIPIGILLLVNDANETMNRLGIEGFKCPAYSEPQYY